MNDKHRSNQQYVTADSVTIHYHLQRQQNAQITLVMLHGLASNSSRWNEFVEHTQLSSSMNILWPDLRGHGQSMFIGPISHNVWLKDLYAILQQETLSKVILVGHSMGAQLALHFALQHSSMVDGLVLIDPTIPQKLKGRLGIARRFRYILKIWITLLLLINKLVPGKTNYPLRDLHVLDLKTRQLMTQQSADIIARLYSSPRRDLKYIPLVNYLQDVYAVTGALPELSNIRCPIQLILSKGSTIVKTGEFEKYFSTEIPLEVAEIESNHWPLTEKPEETRQAIEDWCLKQLER